MEPDIAFPPVVRLEVSNRTEPVALALEVSVIPAADVAATVSLSTLVVALITTPAPFRDTMSLLFKLPVAAIVSVELALKSTVPLVPIVCTANSPAPEPTVSDPFRLSTKMLPPAPVPVALARRLTSEAGGSVSVL